ncbi:2-oxoacid:ferredoxin oxidoreductase subunit beta, partial [bacterium]|nr:2-oxoacid:ferredoxin oxidoreductase subunit beta [bacterium]
TKGQVSATSETDAISKTGNKRELPQVDLASLAIQAGANFVARSFSGAPKQLIPLLQAALAFEGTAILDVISPCITFNNHEGSFRSFPYVMEHRQELHSLDFVPHFQPLEEVDLSEGSYRDVLLHDESTLRLRAVGSEYNPHSRVGALRAISDASKNKEHLMGLLYINTERPSLAATKNMVNIPLAHLQERDLRPSRETLQHTLQSL